MHPHDKICLHNNARNDEGQKQTWLGKMNRKKLRQFKYTFKELEQQSAFFSGIYPQIPSDV